MEGFVECWVLQYFSTHNKDYSLAEIVENCGITYVRLNKVIDHLLDEQLLENREGEFDLTFKGRITLQQNGFETSSNLMPSYEEVHIERMSIEEPFFDKRFLKQKWNSK